MPDRPASRASQVLSTSPPSGVVAPRPVTTTSVAGVLMETSWTAGRVGRGQRGGARRPPGGRGPGGPPPFFFLLLVAGPPGFFFSGSASGEGAAELFSPP